MARCHFISQTETFLLLRCPVNKTAEYFIDYYIRSRHLCVFSLLPIRSLCRERKMSHLIRLWYFSSSIFHSSNLHAQSSNGARCLILVLDPSSTSILYVCEQQRLWLECTDAQARLSLRWSLVAYVINTITS